MIKFTQTNTAPGNCWQTAIACILEIEPNLIPCQVSIETMEYDVDVYDADGKPTGEKKKKVGRSYLNALNSYLEKHHNLMYFELSDYQITTLSIKEPGWHLAMGPTERTPVNNRHHAVVARYGEQVWDPHPSRAFLTTIERWGILTPMTERIKIDRERCREGEWGKTELVCRCPICKEPYL